jgi:large subunit ribosomal protein L10
MDQTTKKVSSNRTKKVSVVAEISEKVNRAKAMVFTNYAGLTHKQLETMKKEIKKADAEFAVAKNTLLKIALNDKKLSTDDQSLDGQTGAMFLYSDIVAPLKTLVKMIKDFEKPQIKFGFLDDKILTSDEIKTLATLPSKEVLLAKLAGTLKAPIYGLHRSLSWNLQKFVMTLNAVAAKKS